MSNYTCTIAAVVHDSFSEAKIYLDQHKNVLIIGATKRGQKVFTSTLRDFIRQKFSIEVEVYFEAQSLDGWQEIHCFNG